MQTPAVQGLAAASLGELPRLCSRRALPGQGLLFSKGLFLQRRPLIERACSYPASMRGAPHRHHPPFTWGSMVRPSGGLAQGGRCGGVTWMP